MAGEAVPRERLEMSPLRRHVQSSYSSRLLAGPEPFVLHVFPDGFVDLLWGPTGQLRVAGPDPRYRTVALPTGTVLAVRFRRGAASGLLGVPLSELAGLRVPLADLWGPDADRITEQIEAAPSEQHALRAMRQALLDRLPDARSPDPLVAAAIELLRRSPATRVADLCDDLGVSDRQLRRRFHLEVGYGPKTLQRIFRVHEFLRLSREGQAYGIAELAGAVGFVDQAHLTNECVELMGFTPVAIIERCARRCGAT